MARTLRGSESKRGGHSPAPSDPAGGEETVTRRVRLPLVDAVHTALADALKPG